MNKKINPLSSLYFQRSRIYEFDSPKRNRYSMLLQSPSSSPKIHKTQAVKESTYNAIPLESNIEQEFQKLE